MALLSAFDDLPRANVAACRVPYRSRRARFPTASAPCARYRARYFSIVICIRLALCSTLVCLAAAVAPGDGWTGDVERGRYLVEQVAMCGECHTPRREDGSLERARWLQGGPIPVHAPPFPSAWAIEAPPIAGLKAYADDQAIRLLTSGVDRTGHVLRPPMPPYRFTAGDAAAVLAYLRTVR
jgi:mono/diheme cytochrome c family protein